MKPQFPAWQPIETAPKEKMLRLWVVPTDPKSVIPTPKDARAMKSVVFGRYAREVEGRWSRKRLGLVRRDVPDADEINGWYLGAVGISKYVPTHWNYPSAAPLPPGPEE